MKQAPLRLNIRLSSVETSSGRCLIDESWVIPQFSPAHGCGCASTPLRQGYVGQARIYGARLGQRARRTVKYACALCHSRSARLPSSRAQAEGSSRRSLVSSGIYAPSLRAPVRNVGLDFAIARKEPVKARSAR